MKTGFTQLDKALPLHRGLCIVGGAPGIGKTSFTMQVADQVAQQGHDVLIFSLVEGRQELITKTISRHTLELGGAGSAMTAQQIRDNYSHYTEQERALVQRSVQAYRAYADNIYIFECVSCINSIEQAIAKHIEVTGKKPLVVVDYLQVLDDMILSEQDTSAILALKSLTRKYGVLILGVSAIKRRFYDKGMSIESFADNIVGADVLIGLERVGGHIGLSVLKNNSGPALNMGLLFHAQYNYLQEVEV